MNKLPSLIGIILLINTVQTQEQNWSTTISYPVTVDQNFIGENYTGFIDLGISYCFVSHENLSVATVFNASIFSNNDNLDIASIDNYKAIMFYLEPKLRVIGTLSSLNQVHLYLGLGYSFFMFDISGVNEGLGIIKDGETLTGFSMNTGLQVDVSPRIYFNLEYDFTKVKQRNLVPNTRYNRNVNIIKLGAGLRF